MSWWDIARDPDAPVGTRIWAGVGCGVLPWVCLAQEGSEHATEAAARARHELEGMVEGEAGGGGLFDQARDTIRELGDAASRPAEAMGNALMWGSVLLGMLLLAVLLGLLIWFVALPLMGLGGPRG